MKKIVFIFLLLTCISSYSNPVSEILSKTIVHNFILNNNITLDLQTLKKVSELVDSIDGRVLYRHYSYGNGNNFIIISADDALNPIFGYSFTNALIGLPKCEQWYKEMLQSAFYSKDELSDDQKIKNLQKWIDLKKNTPKKRAVVLAPIPQLLETNWNQSGVFNDSCPEKNPAGCVAIAMAQIIRYHAIPGKGEGSNSYSHWNYGILSANFGNTTYDWDKIPYAPSYSDAAVSQFVYHCGISINMSYSSSGSAASSLKVRPALVNNFKFSQNSSYISFANYNIDSLVFLLHNELSKSRPIYFAGVVSVGPHALVIDGFDSQNYFHFNFGWGGSYNGYYSLDSEVVAASGKDKCSAVIGIRPRAIPEQINTSLVQELQDEQQIVGNTYGKANEINHYRDVVEDMSGNEAYYKVELLSKGNLTVQLSDKGNDDLRIILLKSPEISSILSEDNEIICANNLDPGTYYVVVDSKYFRNGSYKIKASIANSNPDLVLTYSMLSASEAQIGSSDLRSSLTVKNIGGQAAQKHRLSIVLSTDKIFSNNDIVLFDTLIDPIASLDSINIARYLTIPTNTTIGNYFLISKADADNIISEKNEDANMRISLLSITLPSDLQCRYANSIYINQKTYGNLQMLGHSNVSKYISQSYTYDNYNGSEVVYSFVAPQTGKVMCSFTHSSRVSIKLFCLNSCNPSSCITGAESQSLKFNVEKDKMYYIVLDYQMPVSDLIEEINYMLYIQYADNCSQLAYSGSTGGCEGTRGDTYSIQMADVDSAFWYRNFEFYKKIAPSGITTFEKDGQYQLYTYKDGCLSVSDIITSSHKKLPIIPIIEIEEDPNCPNLNKLSVYKDSSYSYQWYFNRILIPGANTNTLNAFKTGEYFVKASNGGCEVYSPFNDIVAGGPQPAKIGERWYTTSKPYSLYKGFDSYNEYNLCADREDALKAARFDNTNSYDYVTYTTNSTVSVWFKFGAQDFGPIVSFYPYTSFEDSTPDYVLWSDQSGKVYFNMNHSDYQRYHLSSTNSYNDNTWHNATIVIGDVFVKLYIDGELIAQTNYSNATMNQNGWIYYGGGRTAGLPNELSKLNINGSLDDFLLYKTVLTNDEIKALGSRPVVGLNVDKTIICENSGTVQVKVINPEPGVTYTVIDNATGLQIGNPLSINQNIAEAYISLQSTTSLVLKGTLSTSECGTKLSEPINISVNQTVLPTLSIIPTDTCACNASNFSFSYKIDSYGQNYSTKWYVNGSNVAQDAAIFNPSNLQPGDKVWVTYTSSLKCVQPATTTSRKVEIGKCTNALLKQITIGNSCSFLPIFNPNIFEYYALLSDVDTEIPKIVGIPVSSDASVSITMPTTLSGKAILTVTAEDQSYTKTYTINIHHPKYEQEYPILTSAKMIDQQTIELIFNIPINEFSVLFDDFSINTSTSCAVVRTKVDKNQKTRLLLDLNTTLPEGFPVYINYMPGSMSDIYNRLLAGFTMQPVQNPGQIKQRTYTLNAGWNLVGSDLVLENSSIESAFAPIMTSLILCKTNSAFYNPLQSSHLQSLRTWEFGVPILINLSTDVTFTVSGTSFITNGMTLRKGWNFITYTGEAEVTPDQLFGSQLSKLEYIKTFDEWYTPYNALSSMQRIIPGEAYFMKLNDEATLSW